MCVCVRERKRFCVCVRERERVYVCVCARAPPWYVSTFIHLADAFIQTDLQLRNTIRIHYKESNRYMKCV